MAQSYDSVSTFNSAIHAIINGDLEGLKTLLHQFPDLISARSSAPHKATLLHYVAANGVEDEYQKSPENAAEIAEFLLNEGAEVNASAEMYGGGPQNTTLNLLVSSWWPHQAGVQSAVVEVLLAHGGSPNGPLNDGSPLGTALGFGYRKAAETLARLGADDDNILFAAGLGKLEKVKSYFDNEFNLKKTALNFKQAAKEEMGRYSWPPPKNQDPLKMAFIYACINGRLAVAQYLLSAGVSVNCSMSFNQTGLHYAAQMGHYRLVLWLLNHGADPQMVENQFNKTPLQWAEEGNEEQIANIIKHFIMTKELKQLSHGAPVFPVANVQQTAEYYRDKLGFKINFTWEEPASYAVIKRDDIGIHLTKASSDFKPANQHTAFYIFVYDVQKLYEEFKANQVELLNVPTKRDYGLIDFDVKDINGFILSFAGEIVD